MAAQEHAQRPEQTRPVQLVNNYPPPTAIWKISQLTAQAVDQPGCLGTICLGNLDFSTVDPSVSSIHGCWRIPRGLRTFLVYLLPSLTMRDLTSRCRAVVAKEGVVHYLSEDIYPWVGGSRTAVTIHGNPMATLESSRYYDFPTHYRVAVRRNLRKYMRHSAAIVHTEYVKAGLEEFGYDGPIHLLPPALDPTFQPSTDRMGVRRELGLPTDKTLVLSVSTAAPRKNLAVLPEVMDRLGSDFLLLRVGPPVRGSHSFSGLTTQKLAQLYATSDLLLFPTLEEGFGIPIIEAFASGLPVVSSDIPVIREVAGRQAILADPTNPQALARACRDALERRDSLVAGGLQRSQDFGLDALRARLYRVYGSLSG